MECLPTEIVVMILDLLPTKDKIRLSCVSDKIRDIFLSTPVLHRNVSFQNCWSFSSKTICKYISRHSSHIYHLNLQDCYWIKQTELVHCLTKCTQLITLKAKCCNISMSNMNAILDRAPKLKELSYHVPENLDLENRKKIFSTAIQRLSSFDFILSEMTGKDIKLFLEKVANFCLLRQQNCTFRRPGVGWYDKGCTYENEISFQFKQAILPQEPSPSNNARRCDLQNCTGFEVSTASISYEDVLSWHDRRCSEDVNAYYKNCTDNLKYVVFASQLIDSTDSYECLEFFLDRPSLEHIILSNIGIDRFLVERNDDIHLFLSIITSCKLETFQLQDLVINTFEEIEDIVERNHQTLKNINLLVNDCKDHHRDDYAGITNALARCEKLKCVAIRPCCLESKQGSNEPLVMLSQSVKFITELRIIGDNSSEGYSLSSEQLASISEWKCLQRLTLAGFNIAGSNKFLVTICQNCTELQYLSLANLKGPALRHSSNVHFLNTALTFCRNLKDFRLEQPYFDITERFLEALHCAKKLERVCWKVRGGKFAKEHIVLWMNECSSVTCVLLCCDVTKKDAKTLHKLLIDRYSSNRPALVVSIHSLHSSGQQSDPFKLLASQWNKNKFPLVHLEEIACLYTRPEKPWKQK